MFDKLQSAEVRYEEISHKLGLPEVIENQEEYRKLMKEYSKMHELIVKYREYKKVSKDIEESKLLLQDKLEDDFKELVESELKESQAKIEGLKDCSKILYNFPASATKI